MVIVQQTRTILLKEYEQFKIVFEPDNSLPRHGKHDYVIPLIKGKEPQVRLMILITEKDSLVLKEYIKDMLKKRIHLIFKVASRISSDNSPKEG
jgi:hypothetical protein